MQGRAEGDSVLRQKNPSLMTLPTKACGMRGTVHGSLTMTCFLYQININAPLSPHLKINLSTSPVPPCYPFKNGRKHFQILRLLHDVSRVMARSITSKPPPPPPLLLPGHLPGIFSLPLPHGGALAKEGQHCQKQLSLSDFKSS